MPEMPAAAGPSLELAAVDAAVSVAIASERLSPGGTLPTKRFMMEAKCGLSSKRPGEGSGAAPTYQVSDTAKQYRGWVTQKQQAGVALTMNPKRELDDVLCLSHFRIGKICGVKAFGVRELQKHHYQNPKTAVKSPNQIIKTSKQAINIPKTVSHVGVICESVHCIPHQDRRLLRGKPVCSSAPSPGHSSPGSTSPADACR